MSLFPELDEAGLAQLQSWFSSRNGNGHAGEEELWLQEIAFRIANAGPAGIRFLLAKVPRASESRLLGILVGLSSVHSQLSNRRRDEIAGWARTLFADRRPRVVAGAVDLLRLFDCTDARADVLALREDSSPYVVGSVLRFMARHFPREAIPLLEEGLKSKEPIVRENAIDELDGLNCAKALPVIKRLTRDKNRHVRQAARTAAANLAEFSSQRKRRVRDRSTARA